MNHRISLHDLAQALTEEIESASCQEARNIHQLVKDAGRKLKKEIQKTAPKRKNGRSQHPSYAQSWVMETKKDTATATSVILYSRKRYYLTHLLEFGHAKRNGGRVEALPHLAPAVEKISNYLQEELSR